MISSTNFIYLALLPPLLAPIFIFIFKNNQNLRDSVGLIGSLISFYATINITNDIMNGGIPTLYLFNIFSDLSLSFKLKVLSFLWISSLPKFGEKPKLDDTLPRVML